MGNILLRFEKWLVTRADRIITVSEAVKRYFRGIADKPIAVIMNCKPLRSLEYQPPDNRDKFTLLYIGLLDRTRTLPQLINVVKELPDVRCFIGGVGQSGYVESIKEECGKSSNITFVGKVPLDEVLPMTKKADAIFCMFAPGDPNSSIGMPNKLFEAMVCGRPIICTKGIYSGEVTEREQVGLAVEYTEEALKRAVIKLRDAPELRERLGRNALRAAITKYNWQSQEQKLLELYETIESEVD